MHVTFGRKSRLTALGAGLRAAGIVVLLITALILVFLILRSLSAFRRAGFGFFTTASFFPETSDQFGIAALLPDSALIAVIALLVAVPVGVATQYDNKGVAALLACGLVLFVATLIVNSFASVVISRSRSGAMTEAD